MEKFMPDMTEDIKKINKEPETDPEIFDNKKNEYDDEIAPDIKKRAEKFLKEYDGKEADEKGDEKLSAEEVGATVGKYLDSKGKRASEKEKKDFGDFIKEKIDAPTTRRNFLKLMGGVAIALISKNYLLDNINAWWSEFQEQGEDDYEIEYSNELTKLYDEALLMPEKEKGTEDLKLRLDALNDSFKYVETIRNSEKQPLDEFINELSEEDFDALLFGVRHNSPPETAAKILDGLIKNGKKFAEMDFEGLSITDSDDTEAVKKFNEGKLSAEEMASHIQENVDNLLVVAKTNSINISGTEFKKRFDRPRGFGRFTYMSEIVGKAVKTNQDKGIVGFYGGGAHVSLDTWNFSSRKYDEAYNEALENNYTIKEYLEKTGLEPKALLMENWEQLADLDDMELSRIFGDLPKKDRVSFYNKAMQQWQNYLLKEKDPFVSKYPDSKENSFSVVTPAQIPTLPPQFNGLKTSYDNKYLSEILEKFDLRSMTRDDKIIKLEFYVNNKNIPFVEVDSNTGKVIKMYLPKQAKKLDVAQN